MISCFCTVRNGEATLPSTLDSILAQSLREWELVIVDDGSTDRTKLIIEEYAARDKRVRPVYTEGVGRGHALNIALSETRFEYLINVDADDPSHPDRFRILASAADRHPEYSVIYSRVRYVFGMDNPDWSGEESTLMSDECTVSDMTHCLKTRNPITHSAVLMRRSHLASVGYYDASRETIFDGDLWIRLAVSGRRIGEIKLYLVAKRIHVDQSFENKNRWRYLLDGYHLRRRALRDLNGGIFDHGVLILKVVYGLLPQRWRVTVRRLMS